MATKMQLSKRAERLQAAIDAALLRENPTLMSVSVITDFIEMIEVGPYKHSPMAAVHKVGYVARLFGSHRVGKNPGDKFFELKLVPELKSLVIFFIGTSGPTTDSDSYRLSELMGMKLDPADRQDFKAVEPWQVVLYYSGNELRSIIKLINQI